MCQGVVFAVHAKRSMAGEFARRWVGGGVVSDSCFLYIRQEVMMQLRMRSFLLRFLLLCCSSMVLWASDGVSFKLEAMDGNGLYGPFVFSVSEKVVVPSGVFVFDDIKDNLFRLVNPDTDKQFGYYELVWGRVIDVGGSLYKIVDVVRPEKKEVVHAVETKLVAKKSFFDDVSFGGQVDLVNNTKYDWKINNRSGGSADMQRRLATVSFAKGGVNVRGGLILSSEWDETVGGDGVAFENATLKDGSGWFAGLGLTIPVFRDGGWKADVFGDVSYRTEDLSLKYGGWNASAEVTTSVTNGTTNITSRTNYKYINFKEDATLTETLVTIGASLGYESRVWFMYAGVKVLPWNDTSLDATVINGASEYEFSFERSDPVMVYGGGGFFVKGMRCYLEVEGGGVTALRLGLLKEL